MKEMLFSIIVLLSLFACLKFCKNSRALYDNRLLVASGYFLFCLLCLLATYDKGVDKPYIILLSLFFSFGMVFVKCIHYKAFSTVLCLIVVLTNLITLRYILINSLSVSIYGIIYICCGLIFRCTIWRWNDRGE